ncbi:hypothetical protein [Enterovirga sp.]|jgi:hypothetical protein|uniref:hypothetical protein n=1 Tax=Enterovirga sp. TaxID=2026350 RepID=UPI002630D5A8|nr:hypothetical protein [Enterovirga sp.]MDB5590734.1 hypothetical protein [Enterovirga sp.]
MSTPLRYALAVSLLFAAAPAWAQKIGPNGGSLVQAGHHPVEFVPTDSQVVFFMQEEDGRPLATKGMTARASILDGGKSSTVVLAAAEPNRFVGPLAKPLARGAKVVMTTRAHGHALEARFEVK